MLIDFKEIIDNLYLESIAKCIRDGGLVVFPTETVYGIGADAFNKTAVKNIFKAKGRASDNPLIAHISSIDMLEKLTNKVSDTAKLLMDRFWPGPLTIIFDKLPSVPYEVTGGLDTVAVRMPSNEIALNIISKSDTPIVAPSANISGKPSGTCVQDIYDELHDKVDIIVDGGNTLVGIESTVVRIDDDIVTILRPGKVTMEDIEAIGIKCHLDRHIFVKVDNQDIVSSPGMKYKHYAPDAKCVMIEGAEAKKIEKVLDLARNADGRVLILSVEEHLDRYQDFDTINIGTLTNYETIAKNIFSAFRKANKMKPDLIILEGIDRKGLGVSIMNRMIRACAYNVINV